jgi:ABC-type Fe3+ transport system permease subunit
MKGSLNRSVRVASLAAAVALVLSLSLGTYARRGAQFFNMAVERLIMFATTIGIPH